MENIRIICYMIYAIYILERKRYVWEIRTSPAHLLVQHTNHWATEHVKIVNRLYIYNHFHEDSVG